MNEKKLKQYAKLIIEKGLNVHNGQLVVVRANLEAYPLVRLISKEAYKKGAKDVIVKYQDEQIEHDHLLYADPSCFENVLLSESLFYDETAQAGACYLTLTGNDPDLMRDADPKRITMYRKSFNRASKEYRKQIDQMKVSWCIAAAPTASWAQKVFPTLSKEEAIDALWDSIFQACRVDEEYTLENWQNHLDAFQDHVTWLNGLSIQSLWYKNKAGTDLEVRLPENYRFVGGDSKLQVEGTPSYSPNIPTEEIFSVPFKYGVNGRLVATLPLVYQGNRIEDFWFEFKDGKVVDYDAKVGKGVLESILETDEGAKYLGEVALVPADSPIAKMRRLFYNTLFDENASCHFALGKAYLECVENGLEMDEEAQEQAGLNVSSTHVDFMVGSDDLSIIARCLDGKEVPIFQDGCWVSRID